MVSNKIIDVQRLTRSAVLRRLGVGGMAFCSGALTTCAIDSVTGINTMVFLSEQNVVNLDRSNSPHQLSSDYDKIQDSHLQTYLNQEGQNISVRTHHPQMPHFFPGGTVASTRSIPVELDNEAERNPYGTKSAMSMPAMRQNRPQKVF